MADQVADLYAKVRFDVDKKGLQEAQKLLSEFAKQMSALNALTKQQAEIQGIFSKEKSKQNNEEEKQEIEQYASKKERIRQFWKEKNHSNQLERMARKEEMQDKRFQQKEQEHLWRMEERASKTHHSNMAKYARQGARGLLRIARNSLKLLAHTTQATWKSVIAPSLSGAVDVRDFMMYTGTNLNRLQEIQERFASVGSSMSREDIMGELSNAMSNLTKIRFGEGELSGYKLGGIQAYAARGDISKVLNMLETATQGVDNQAAVELFNRIGLSGQRWLPYFRARQRVNTILPRLGQEGQEQLVDAQSSLQVLMLGFQRSGEILTSKFAPLIRSVSETLVHFMNALVQDVDVQKVGGVISELLNDFATWVSQIKAEDIKNWIKRFFKAMKTIVEKIEKFAETLDKKPWIPRIVYTGKEPQKQTIDPMVAEMFDPVGAKKSREKYAHSSGAFSQYIVNNNPQTTTTIQGVLSDDLAKLVEKVTEDGVSKGMENVNTMFNGTLAGV